MERHKKLGLPAADEETMYDYSQRTLQEPGGRFVYHGMVNTGEMLYDGSGDVYEYKTVKAASYDVLLLLLQDLTAVYSRPPWAHGERLQAHIWGGWFI